LPVIENLKARLNRQKENMRTLTFPLLFQFQFLKIQNLKIIVPNIKEKAAQGQPLLSLNERLGRKKPKNLSKIRFDKKDISFFKFLIFEKKIKSLSF